MPEIQSNSIIVEIQTLFDQRMANKAKQSMADLDNSIEKLNKRAATLGTGSKEFAKVTAEITRLNAQKEKLTNEKINIEFELFAIKEAKTASAALDKEIRQLQKDVLALGTGSEQAAAKIAKIGDLKKQKSGLDKSISLGEAKISGIGNIGEATKGIGGLANVSGLAGKALAGLGLAFGAFQLINFIKSSSEAAKEIENLASSFKAFGIEEKRAFELANQIDNLEAKLPFEGEQIKSTAKNLLKFNVSAGDLEKTISKLSAIAKGADFSLDSLSDTFGRANKEGKVFGRDFLQVYKNIPGLVDAIAANTGKSIAQITKLGKAGKLSFEDFNAGINTVTESTGKYGKVLTEFQNSTEGLQKKIKEFGGDLQEAFGQEFNKGLKDFFGEFDKVDKEGITLFVKALGTGFGFVAKSIGFAASLLGTLIGALAKAPSKLGDLFDAFEEGRIRFGGRLFIIDPKVEFKPNTDIKDVIAGIDADVAAALEKSGHKIKELEEDQLAALEEFKKKVKDALSGLNKINIAFDIEFGSEDQKDAKLKKIKEEGRQRIEDAQKVFDSLKEEKKKLVALGIDFNLKPFEKELQKTIANIATEINEKFKRAEFEVTAHIETITEFNKRKLKEEREELTALLENELGGRITIEKALEFNITSKDFLNPGTDDNLFPDVQKKLTAGFEKELEKSKNKLKGSFADYFEKLKEFNAKGQADLKADQEKDRTFKNTFLAKLFGLDNPEQQKKLEDGLKTFASKALEASNTFIDAELNKTDFLITETQKRLDALLAIQEGGNVEQINLEQERLDKLNEQKQKDLKLKQQIDAITIVANDALTISNLIAGLSKAFLTNPILGAVESLAIGATLASLIATISSTLNTTPGHYKGTEMVGEKETRTFNTGKDDYLVKLDKGERVLTRDQNKEIPRSVKNNQVPDLIQKGLQFYKEYKTIENKKVIENSKVFNSVVNNSETKRITNNSKLENLIKNISTSSTEINNEGSDKTNVFKMPSVSQMAISPKVTVIVDNKEGIKEQKETNKILNELKKITDKKQTNFKIVNQSETDKIILKRMAK